MKRPGKQTFVEGVIGAGMTAVALQPPSVWWHGTSKATWARIQEEGVLWGIRDIGPEFHPSRCTYLCTTRAEATSYGDVILRVEWTPTPEGKHNYTPDCWQVRVYDPIPLSQVRQDEEKP